MSTWSLTTDKAYLSDSSITNIYKSFTHKMAAKPAGIHMERNYVTVTRACRVDIRVEVASLGCSEHQTGQCVITERRQHTLGHQEFIVAECQRCVSACQHSNRWCRRRLYTHARLSGADLWGWLVTPGAAAYFTLILCVWLKLFRCRFVPLLEPNPGDATAPRSYVQLLYRPATWQWQATNDR